MKAAALHLFLFGWLVSWAHPVSAQETERAKPPVSATFLSKDADNWKFKSIIATLVLTNGTKRPVWFVIPLVHNDPPMLQGAVRIKESLMGGKFLVANCYNLDPYQIELKDVKGKAIRLTVHASNDESFHLFRLPPGGRVEFESFDFQAPRGYFPSFRVRVADEIMVNGGTPLERWLPYETLSDQDVLVRHRDMAEAVNLNFDLKTLETRTDLKAIDRLDLHITGEWDIPFDGYK
jgi:hypothetical protein